MGSGYPSFSCIGWVDSSFTADRGRVATYSKISGGWYGNCLSVGILTSDLPDELSHVAPFNLFSKIPSSETHQHLQIHVLKLLMSHKPNNFLGVRSSLSTGCWCWHQCYSYSCFHGSPEQTYFPSLISIHCY